MKYSEFKKEVEKLGCEVYDRGCDLFVKRNTHTILTVNKNREFEFDNEWNKWSWIGEIKSPLFDLAYQLAKTPLAEREEEKKYNVVLPLVGSSTRYMQRNEYLDGVLIFDNSERGFIKSHPELYAFTEQEIKDIDERYLAFKVEVTPE